MSFPGITVDDVFFSIQVGSAAGEGFQSRWWYASDTNALRVASRGAEEGTLFEIVGFKNPVLGSEPTPPDPPPTATFSANPTSVGPGGTATLTWDTEDATTVSINQGIGAVAADGTRTVSPSSTTTYTLTATNDEGSTVRTVTVTVEMIDPSDLPSVNFFASPATIAPGGSSDLTWVAENTIGVSIDQGIGSVGLNDVLEVSPSATTTYTLTATNGNGTTVRTATVTVQAPLAGSVEVDRASLTVGEGSSGTFRVRLVESPTETVTVTLTPNLSILAVSPTSLTFTAQNWSAWQTVIVSAAQDSDMDNESGRVTVRNVTLNESTFVNITVADDDVVDTLNMSGTVFITNGIAQVQDTTPIPSSFGSGSLSAINIYEDGDVYITTSGGGFDSGTSLRFVWTDSSGNTLTRSGITTFNGRININSSTVASFYAQLVFGETSTITVTLS